MNSEIMNDFLIDVVEAVMAGVILGIFSSIALPFISSTLLLWLESLI